MKTVKQLALATAISAALFSQAMAGTLVINSNQSDPAPKAAVDQLIERFEAANPDITVKYNLYDHEAYKTTIRNWLVTTPPDVVFWFAGNRMKTFVDRGLFEDVSDVWQDNQMYDNFGSTTSSLTVDGKQYGVPFTYYQWGIYYRNDLFEKAGITSEPKTWDEFIAANNKLKAAGITPITIGTKYLWTAAGWFDYLNMRTNGLDFHIQLMDGKVPYTDERVKATFANWKQLIDGGYFIDNHASYSWQEAQPFMYNGDAAMYLMGNFITPNFPADVEDKMSFMQFPVINPEVGIAEDAPTDTIHIPARAKNKDDARRFLAFVAQEENQTLMNQALNQIPPHKNSKANDNKFLNSGVSMLGAADGTAQFYDRDTDPAMAKVGMEGFQEFMVYPERLDTILTRLEKTRQRIFR